MVSSRVSHIHLNVKLSLVLHLSSLTLSLLESSIIYQFSICTSSTLSFLQPSTSNLVTGHPRTRSCLWSQLPVAQTSTESCLVCFSSHLLPAALSIHQWQLVCTSFSVKPSLYNLLCFAQAVILFAGSVSSSFIHGLWQWPQK
jgi:hypothetical protein